MKESGGLESGRASASERPARAISGSPLRGEPRGGAPDDAALALKAAKGDRGAFERLAWLWWDRIRGFCSAIVAFDGNMAEEAAQEALLRLHKALPHWRGSGSIGGFIYGVCRNSAADTLRKQIRHSSRHIGLSETSWSGIADKRENPEQEAMRRELSLQIERAMGALGVEDRALVYLFEVEGASVKELSSFFTLPEGTVKSRLFRIRAKLAAALEEAGYGKE